MRWAVIFKDKPEMMEIRADRARRDKHVAYAKAHPELLIGGGLKRPEGTDFTGALWIVEADDVEAVKTLICNDPFYIAEYRDYEIYSWGKILEDKKIWL